MNTIDSTILDLASVIQCHYCNNKMPHPYRDDKDFISYGFGCPNNNVEASEYLTKEKLYAQLEQLLKMKAFY